MPQEQHPQPTTDRDVDLMIRSMTPTKAVANDRRILSRILTRVVFGFGFAFVAVWFFPPIFGGLGVAFGRSVVGYEGYRKVGRAVVIANIVTMSLGMVLDVLFWIGLLTRPVHW